MIFPPQRRCFLRLLIGCVAEKFNIHFGIAGWSYPDWTGYVYPRGVKDPLAFLASYVDVIELNSTFYRPPSERDGRSWLERTSACPGFFFTAKLHQAITHQDNVTTDLARRFHAGLGPLAAAGKLRHLLAQFRYDFDDVPAHRDQISRIRENFSDLANLTLELRHSSWQAPAALDWLEALGVTVANLDYPLARNSFDLRECRVGVHRYLRLHGRNAAAWFDRCAGRDETYNYLYSKPELEEIRQRAHRLAESAQSLTVIANNHFQGKEVANILQLKALLTGQPVPAPPLLVERYPDLKTMARPEADLWNTKNGE